MLPGNRPHIFFHPVLRRSFPLSLSGTHLLVPVHASKPVYSRSINLSTQSKQSSCCYLCLTMEPTEPPEPPDNSRDDRKRRRATSESPSDEEDDHKPPKKTSTGTSSARKGNKPPQDHTQRLHPTASPIAGPRKYRLLVKSSPVKDKDGSKESWDIEGKPKEGETDDATLLRLAKENPEELIKSYPNDLHKDILWIIGSKPGYSPLGNFLKRLRKHHPTSIFRRVPGASTDDVFRNRFSKAMTRVQEQFGPLKGYSSKVFPPNAGFHDPFTWRENGREKFIPLTQEEKNAKKAQAETSGAAQEPGTSTSRTFAVPEAPTTRPRRRVPRAFHRGEDTDSDSDENQPSWPQREIDSRPGSGRGSTRKRNPRQSKAISTQGAALTSTQAQAPTPTQGAVSTPTQGAPPPSAQGALQRSTQAAGSPPDAAQPTPAGPQPVQPQPNTQPNPAPGAFNVEAMRRRRAEYMAKWNANHPYDDQRDDQPHY
jgi:hypothetical protein